MPDDDKDKLEKAIEALQMRFGSRAVRRMGEGAKEQGSRLATGFPALDDALDGGVPRGRIVEIFGVPTAGVATLALRTAAQAQIQGEEVVYLDLEQTFDPDYAAGCGVVLERLILVHPRDARQALALVGDFVHGGGVLVCDLPLSAVSDPQMARVLSTTLGRLLVPLGHSSLVLLCLVSLPSGQASYPQHFPLRHYAAVRLQLQRERWIYRRKDIRGYQAQVLVVKNKPGRAGQTVNVDIAFGDSGIGGQP